MVLLNGLFADLQSWDPVVDDLAEHFHVLRYNSRGQGGAPLGEGFFELEDQVDDLLNLLEQHQIRKTHLLGLSHGARIGLAFAAKAPDKVARMALASCFANPDALLQAKLESWREASRCGGGALRFDTALPWIWGQQLLEHKSELIEAYRQKASQTPQDVPLKLIHAALSGKVDTSGIHAPTLLLAGREDLLTPAWKVHELAQELKYCEFLECPGAHSFLLERPQVVKDSMIPFLTSSQREVL